MAEIEVGRCLRMRSLHLAEKPAIRKSGQIRIGPDKRLCGKSVDSF